MKVNYKDVKNNKTCSFDFPKLIDWNIEAMTGYKPKTTFYTDFSIADSFGLEGIKDTFKRCFEMWKDNVEQVTELCLAVNWKSWEHYQKNDAYCELYVDLYDTLYDWCANNLKDDDLTYFFETID